MPHAESVSWTAGVLVSVKGVQTMWPALRCIEGWVEGGVEGCIEGCAEGYLQGCMEGYVEGCMEGCIEGCIKRWHALRLRLHRCTWADCDSLDSLC